MLSPRLILSIIYISLAQKIAVFLYYGEHQVLKVAQSGLAVKGVFLDRAAETYLYLGGTWCIPP